MEPTIGCRPTCRNSTGHRVLRQGLPPPFGRWLTPSTAFRVVPERTRRAGPRHRGLPVFLFVASAAGTFFPKGEGDPVFSIVSLGDSMT